MIVTFNIPTDVPIKILRFSLRREKSLCPASHGQSLSEIRLTMLKHAVCNLRLHVWNSQPSLVEH